MNAHSFHMIPAAVLLASSAAAQTISPDGRALPRPDPPTPWIEIPVESTDKPCTVDALDIDAKVDGLHARVSTTITIRNPNPRPISAPLVFPLPEAAAVCGYALEINGALIDGVVVPKEKARVAFETEQRRGVDPGLVEAVKGNVYRTRVYPVPANGTRRVRVDWVAPLALGPDGASAALALPMPDCTLAHRTVTIEVADNTAHEPPTLGGFGDRRFERAERFWRVSGTEENVAPRDDLLIALPKLPDTIVSTERTPDGDTWFCASTRVSTPAPPQAPVAPAESFTVFWDASASYAGKHEKELKFLLALRAMPTGTYRLVVFRNTPDPVQTFDTVAALVDAILCVAYDGGTDLAALAPALAETEGPVYLFTDGMDTLSGKPVDFGPAADRVTVLVSGAETDVESLRQACGGRVFDPAESPEDTVYRYERRVRGLDGSGVADVQGIGSRAWARATVLGRLTAPDAKVALRYDDDNGGEAIALDSAAAKPGTTLATAWAAMRVQQLSPRADDNEEELLALGRRFGLASPATSLLVLESLDQWLRHDIEPPASLPEMRQQWLVAKKNRPGEDPEAKAARHLEMLKNQWKQRMEWWETDWAEVAKKAPKPEPVDGEPERPGLLRRVFGGAVRNESARRSVAMDAPMADGMVMAQADFAMAEEAAPAMAMANGSAAGAVAPDSSPEQAGASPAGAISVKAWSPDTPYLKALDAAGSEARVAYIARRWGEWSSSPAFFLDCAGWFFAKGDREFAVRILSNLAELRIEDPALLRVLAWRLKEAKAYESAIVILRRVCKLRPEDAQSWRDLALVLDEAGRAAFADHPDDGAPSQSEMGSEAAEAPALLAEALSLYRKVALTPWARHPDSISLIAVEEHNALLAWCTNHSSLVTRLSSLEPLPEGLSGTPDCDMRVVMAWDADETDVDLHVTEPSGEEAYYGHRRTRSGGDVSKDITDGYGPEEYLLRKAPAGAYKIRAHYFASHQQAVFGPATVTATIFTDWGRPNQAFQTLSIRLDKAREMIDLGSVQIGAEGRPSAQTPSPAELRKGMTLDEAKALLGEPASTEGETLVWPRPGGRTLKAAFADGKLIRAVEVLPGGAETILVQ